MQKITYGQALKSYRKSKGLTAKQVREMYKVVTGTDINLGAIEVEIREPSKKNMDALCVALDCYYGTNVSGYYFADKSQFS